MKRPYGLRTREATASLIRRNAEACEGARWPACQCHCGGALHGKKHSEKWISETADQIYDQTFAILMPEYRKFYEEK
jgi:hypothetical protein